jgi:hypothetical protein
MAISDLQIHFTTLCMKTKQATGWGAEPCTTEKRVTSEQNMTTLGLVRAVKLCLDIGPQLYSI